MTKYNIPHKVKGGLGGTLHMNIDASSGYLTKPIIECMIATNIGEVTCTLVPLK